MRNLELTSKDIKSFMRDEYDIKASDLKVKVSHGVDTYIEVTVKNPELNKAILSQWLKREFDYQRTDARDLELNGGNQFVLVY